MRVVTTIQLSVFHLMTFSIFSFPFPFPFPLSVISICPVCFHFSEVSFCQTISCSIVIFTGYNSFSSPGNHPKWWYNLLVCCIWAPSRNPTTKAVHCQGIQTEISNHVKFDYELIIPAFSWNVQFSPKITPNGFQYAHHMLIYLCDFLNETMVGTSAPCGGIAGAFVSECRQGSLIAGWAVGGTVSIAS